jgi:hypothetical protein
MENNESLVFLKKYFYDYFEKNQTEYVCTVSSIIRDDIMTISQKGEKSVHIKIKELQKFEGSDNIWCVYDPLKFQLDKIELDKRNIVVKFNSESK